MCQARAYCVLLVQCTGFWCLIQFLLYMISMLETYSVCLCGLAFLFFQ